MTAYQIDHDMKYFTIVIGCELVLSIGYLCIAGWWRERRIKRIKEKGL